MKIGIIFGGASREREVSFAGGRTVYDNLDKNIFSAVPIFVDSFGNFIELEWPFIYKGSIRDFYPPVGSLPPSPHDFQVYAESLDVEDSFAEELLTKGIGRKIEPGELKNKIDFAFLALHGPMGEDGTIQGMLEWMRIPYSGSGIFPSAMGINKFFQKDFQVSAGFKSPRWISITRKEWFGGVDKSEFFARAKEKIGFPMVVKASSQGSSIGITVLNKDDAHDFISAMNRSFFSHQLLDFEWNAKSRAEKVEWVRSLCDIREGIGVPVKIGGEIIRHPENLLEFIEETLHVEKKILIEALDSESRVLVEEFIDGREFSCIVVRDEEGKPIALPPTEIRKGREVFDYRSKYLPGLSRKITPIDLPSESIAAIRRECERLYSAFHFNVYARIDGFIKKDGTIFLNDPNTTSGMMPSSFFFHQAAEIGLNPSQFLTYIIRTSMAERVEHLNTGYRGEAMLLDLDTQIANSREKEKTKTKIAVIMGGYSTERHISVESGRNIYEKLSSSADYEPIPVFLTGNDREHELYVLPVNIMLKDNADDILEKVHHFHQPDSLKEIIRENAPIAMKYGHSDLRFEPQRISYPELGRMVEGVFIALHGRPGEDGSLQRELEKVGLYYNGSGPESSEVTINKYITNKILRDNGFLVADHLLVKKEDWLKNKASIKARIAEMGFPLIAKPADEGCSSAVKKISDIEKMEAYAGLVFRNEEERNPSFMELLQIGAKEEFPPKDYFLVEKFISKENSVHFLEVTGGLLTHLDAQGGVEYEIFEPSETLAEGEVLSLEEKFLAGQGQNITPARFSTDPEKNRAISDKVREDLKKAARVLNIEGYARIDAFVRIGEGDKVETVFIEVNSLPGMTPATCIFHQCAINGYKPLEFIDRIIQYGKAKHNLKKSNG